MAENNTPLPKNLMNQTDLGRVMLANGYVTEDQLDFARTYQNEYKAVDRNIPVEQILQEMSNGTLKYSPTGDANPGTEKPITDATIATAKDVQSSVRGELAENLRRMGYDPQKISPADAGNLIFGAEVTSKLQDTWKAADERHRRVDKGLDIPKIAADGRIEPGKGIGQENLTLPGDTKAAVTELHFSAPDALSTQGSGIILDMRGNPGGVALVNDLAKALGAAPPKVESEKMEAVEPQRK